MKSFAFASIGLALLLAFGALTQSQPPRTFRVALQFIPQTLDPRSNQINTNHYILLQAYDPLFATNESGNLTSAFLDMKRTRSLEDDFRSYRLCLRNDARFSDGSEVTSQDLLSSLREAHRVLESLPAISTAKVEGESSDGGKGCVRLELEQPDFRYFDKLQGVASTILKQGTERSAVPIGNGPFRIDSLTPEKITLVRSARGGTGAVDRIEFVVFSSVAHARSEPIDDWNHVYQTELPEALQEGFQSVRSPVVKSYALLINVPYRRDRLAIGACLHDSGIADAVALKLERTAGFLPNGLLGSNVPVPRGVRSHCQRVGRGEVVPFLTNQESHVDRLGAILKSRGLTRVRLELLSSRDMVKKVYSGAPYVAVIGFDSSGSSSSGHVEPSVFFESFIRDEKLIGGSIPRLREVVSQAVKSTSALDKAKLYRRAHQMLLESGYVLPLGQLVAIQRYPRRVASIRWADRISGFPNLDTLRFAP